MKPEISRQLTQLVTRVMNDAFSELPADKLLNNLNRSARSGHSLISPNAPVITFPLQHNVERRGHAHRVNSWWSPTKVYLVTFSGRPIPLPSWQEVINLESCRASFVTEKLKENGWIIKSSFAVTPENIIIVSYWVLQTPTWNRAFETFIHTYRRRVKTTAS